MGFFVPRWAELEQGQYFISLGTGSVFAKDQASSVLKSEATFNEGSTVEIEFDQANNALSFFQEGEKKWEFRMAPAPEGDCYRPCVSLWR